MRKNIATRWVFVTGISLVFLFSAPGAKAQALNRPLSLGTLAHEINSPQAIARYMWRHFAFEHDRRQFGQDDYWQSPEELLVSGKGDCEDFALFAKAMLSELGIKSYIVNIYGHRYAHTVTVYEENGKYNAIDLTNVRQYRANSLKELISMLYPYWDHSAIVAPSSKRPTGKILKRIERQAQLELKLTRSA